MISFATKTAAILLLCGVAASPVAAAELKLSGAAALANTVVMPNKAAIEQETGVSLAVTINGDGNGLKDLLAGKNDVMMVAAPIAATAAALNRAAPGSVDASGVVMAQVGAISIKFVVNSNNPVKSLTPEQIRALMLGKIANWKEVGGPDLPVMVVAEAPGFGTRTNVVASFLNGEEIAPSARTMQALVQVAQVVAQAPGAIGYASAASMNPGVVALSGAEVSQPLGVATRGPANDEVKKLIAAISKYAASVK